MAVTRVCNILFTLLLLQATLLVVCSLAQEAAEHRKCHDCEGFSDGRCGEKLDYPGGISCESSQTTQCYRDILYGKNDKLPSYIRHCLEWVDGEPKWEDGCYNITRVYVGEVMSGTRCVCSDRDNCNGAISLHSATNVISLTIPVLMIVLQNNRAT